MEFIQERQFGESKELYLSPEKINRFRWLWQGIYPSAVWYYGIRHLSIPADVTVSSWIMHLLRGSVMVLPSELQINNFVILHRSSANVVTKLRHLESRLKVSVRGASRCSNKGIEEFSMYPEEIVAPCRSELTDIGVKELRSAEEVDAELKDHKGTTFLIVNSVCGCAAGSARPAIRLAKENQIQPDRMVTVFAGVDSEATARAREYMIGYAPSSPSLALFKDGELVFMVERFMIEGRYPEQIAAALKDAFNFHCGNGDGSR